MGTGEEPFLIVLRGAPDDEEIAAATVALLALTRAAVEPESVDSPGWTPVRGYRSPGAWTSF
jgi:hypothetical protein